VVQEIGILAEQNNENVRNVLLNLRRIGFRKHQYVNFVKCSSTWWYVTTQTLQQQILGTSRYTYRGHGRLRALPGMISILSYEASRPA
jgi:hypothetical protein